MRGGANCSLRCRSPSTTTTRTRLQRLLAAAEALPEAQEACGLAVGWVSAQSLRGISRDMLASPSAFQRRMALAACGFHRVDPGPALADALRDDDATLRAQALRTAGDCARQDLAAAVVDAIADADAGCRLWAARTALMLGERGRAPLEALQQLALQAGPLRAPALSVLLKCIAPAQAAPLLRQLLDEPAGVREAVRGMGTVGDPQVIPWLIAQMDDPVLSRLAGEAFSMITGLDLAWLDLESKPPEAVESGPNDDPQDDKVAMDEDDGLPWPDREKISAWWQANGHRFAAGTRYFMGEPPSPAHCLAVLKNGFQRQRMAAAVYLCLFEARHAAFQHRRAGLAPAALARRHGRLTMHGRQIHPCAARRRLPAAALWRLSRDGFKLGAGSRTWLLMRAGVRRRCRAGSGGWRGS